MVDTRPSAAGGFLRSVVVALHTPRAEWLIVGALTLVALVLRWSPLQVSLHDDELFLYAIVNDHSLGEVMSIVHDTEKTPPLGFVLSCAVRGRRRSHDSAADSLARRGHRERAAGLPARAAHRRARGRDRGRGLVRDQPVPDLLLRPVAARTPWSTAFVIVATLALLLALEQRRLRWWVLYAVAATAAVYSHYIAALVLVPQAAWALWTHRESVRDQLLAHAAVVVAFLPWLPSFIVQARHSDAEAAFIATVAPVNLSTIEGLAPARSSGIPASHWTQLPGYFPEALILTALGVALVVTGYRWIATRRAPSPPRAGGLLVLLAIFPLVALILYSLQPDTSFLLPRNLAVAVPYALLLIGWLLTRPPPMVATALSVVALAGLGVGAVKIQDPDNQPPDGRDAARFIDAHAPPNAAYMDSQVVPFDEPNARNIRIYLERPHRVYPRQTRCPRCGRRRPAPARRCSSPSWLPLLAELPDEPCGPPPPPYASQYELVAEHATRGSVVIVVCGYAPR